MKLLIAILAALALVACDKKEPADPAETPPESDEAAETDEAAPEPEEEADEAQEGQAAANYADLTGDEWCIKAHEETVAFVEGIKTSMKENDQNDEYDVATREEYVELCEQLPEAMQKCVVIGYARQHEEECVAAEKALEGEEREAYDQLMGT